MARGLKKNPNPNPNPNPKKAKRKNKGGKKKDDGSSSSAAPEPSRVWRPGVDELEEGEELQCDPSAYNSLHTFHIGWPCLSFDIVNDSEGMVRTEFPHNVICIAGTQAAAASENYIGVFKVSNISGKKRKFLPKEITDGPDMESESSDSDEDDEEAGGAGAPVLQVRKVFHEGGVNRIRCMRQNPHICATWAESGHVQVWDFSQQLNGLADSVHEQRNTLNQPPLVKFNGHKDEGFALDWSPFAPGRLLSGDCKGFIHFWEPASDSTWNIDSTPYAGHTASVEDLQWSPSEKDVFASCSVDGTIAIWDVRVGKKPLMSIQAHNADVNVISWSSLASAMIASGSDDGSFSIRDLRMCGNSVQGGNSVVADFSYHKHPITSIEWSPHENTTLAVSSADNQLTIWDLSLERDEEEEAEFKARIKEQVNAPTDLPPQLLFVHQGQKDLKELHWHSQIPGMIVSTAVDGFNILMPSNIEIAIPAASQQA